MRKKDQNTRCHECQNWREKQLSNSVDSKPGRTHTAARLYQQKIWWPSRLRLAGSVLASTLPSSSVWSFRRWAKAWVSWWFFMPEIDLNTFEAFCNSKTLRVTWYLVVEEMVPSVGSFPRWTKFSTLAHPLRYFPPPPQLLGKRRREESGKKKRRQEGTYHGWLLLFQINQVAILPLGTGNDIARVTGWGSGYKGQKISTILAEVAGAEIQSLDRWSVEMKQKGGEHKVDKHVMS